MRAPFLYLRNGRSDWAKILHVGRYHTITTDVQLKVGVLPHVRTCARLFCISETTHTIVLKFCMWPGIEHLLLTRSSDLWCNCTCARDTPFLYLKNCLSERG